MSEYVRKKVLSDASLRRMFTPSSPPIESAHIVKMIREQVLSLAKLLNTNCPGNEESELALRHLHLVQVYAVKSMATEK